MPTYSYKCTECGNAFDIQQAFTDDSLSECPVCGGPLRKVFGAVGVTFNGSGFYRNDSRAAAGKRGSSGHSDGRKKEPSSTGAGASGSGSSASSNSGDSGSSSSSSATSSSGASAGSSAAAS